MRGIISLLVIAFLASSCKEEKSAKDPSEIEFRYYNLENMGWKSKVEEQKIDSMTFKATLVPIQYYILKQEGKENLVSADSLYEAHKTERIIEFIFEDAEQEDVLQEKFTNIDYSQSVQYISDDIKKDFFVITASNDTIPCSGVLHERTFKISPSTKILLFFSNVDPNEKIQLLYKDALYQKGNVKLRFSDPILNL